MARICAREFLDLPLRVHSFLRDVPLHDVWVVDLPGGREGITLLEFRSRSGAGRTEDIPYATKALLQLRFLLGRIFRLDTPSPGQKSASYIRLLNEADRVRFAGATGIEGRLLRRCICVPERDAPGNHQRNRACVLGANAHADLGRIPALLGDIRETGALDYAGVQGPDRSVPSMDRLSASSEQSTRAMDRALR